ncbi:MAG TPA: PHB depolymerase family esterase [Planktothrix sp.]|jgi:polyhydroxybutyrate depolymerase
MAFVANDTPQKTADTTAYPSQTSGEDAYRAGAPTKLDTRPQTADKHLKNTLELVDHTNNSEHTALQPGDHRYTISVDGKDRQFEVHVPPGYDGKKPYPVVYMMPGMGGSIDQQKHETGMNNRQDAIIVYTQPLPKDFPGDFNLTKQTSWNLNDGSLTKKDASYDDMDYMRRVNQLVSHQVNVDKNAQYIAGFSEGGGAAQYVAEQMPGTFAAVASVHGTYLEGEEKPQKDSGTAFIDVMGTSDHMLPMSGGRGLMTLTTPIAAESRPLQQATNWAAANECSAPTVKQDGTNTVTDYACRSGDVEQIVRQGGEHAWDGKGLNGKADFGWYFVGMPDTTQDTTRDIMNFFNAHRKQGS